jgi:hypothetical protein
MKRFGINIKTTLLALFGGLMIVLAPQLGQAQCCRGSHLFYIVRDGRGAAIDAAGKDLQFDKDSGWYALDWDSIRERSPEDVPVLDGINKLDSKMTRW